MIINGELQTGLGGGVCQVSTTVFNAAYEAGLRITSRTNHALYISHYPLGRDATVNYPDTDLRFVNDTGHWLLASHVRRLVVADGDAVRHEPAPQGRERDGAARGRRPGAGEDDDRSRAARRPDGRRRRRIAALTTSVERRVYDRKGKLLYDDHWSSHYRGDYRLVRVGSKQPPPPAEEEAADDDDDSRRPRPPRRRPPPTTTTTATATPTDYDSALAIASTIHCGRRVGRSVCASTHACVVQPSAMRASSPTRSST